MQLTSRLHHSPAGPNPAVALLGERHPLVKAIRRLDLAVRQLLVAVAILIGAGGALATGSTAAPALAVGAAVAALLLAIRVGVLLESRHACVLALIRNGHGGLPIPLVEHAGAELIRPRHRQRMTKSIEALLDPRIQRFEPVTNPRQFLRGDLAGPVRRELEAIARLLAEPDVDVQGVALLERLLFDGMSSLYGDNARLLRDDLRRIRFLLERSSAAR